LAEEPALNKAPTVADWVRLSKLPDWSGVWNPNISDQNAQIKTNPVPWKPEVEARINRPRWPGRKTTVPAQAFVNSTLSWTSADDHFVVVLSSKNLLDSQKRVSSSYTPSTGVRFVNFPDPRTFMATLKYQL
jgi:hypothetical protein